MSIGKISTYFAGGLIILVALSSMAAGVWMISIGSSGLAFVISGLLLLFVGWRNIYIARTKFPSVKIPVDQTIVAEWTFTKAEINSHMENVKARTKSTATTMAVGGFIVMFLMGYFLFDASMPVILTFSMLIPTGVLIGLIVRKFTFKKWLASDGRIVIKKSAIILFESNVPLLGSNFWPESAVLIEDVSPPMIQINMKYSGRSATTTQTYVPVPIEKIEEGRLIAELIGKIKSAHVASGN